MNKYIHNKPQSSSDASLPSAASTSAKREGLLSRIGHGITGAFKPTSGGVDEFGVQKPGKQSKASTFLDYLLPSLFTVAGGAGLPLGLMAGKAMRNKQESDTYGQYQASRKQAQNAALEGAQQAETARHNVEAEKIARSHAAAAWRPSETERLLEKYLKGAGEMADIRAAAEKATEQNPLAPDVSKRFDALKRQEDAYSGALFPKTVEGVTSPYKPKNMTPDEWEAYQDLDAAFKDPKQKTSLSDVQLQQYQVLKKKAGMQ